MLVEHSQRADWRPLPFKLRSTLYVSLILICCIRYLSTLALNTHSIKTPQSLNRPCLHQRLVQT